MKVVWLIISIIIAAAGGALLYHALFTEPPKSELISSTGRVRDLPNMLHVVGGSIMLVGGMALAFFAARRRPM